MISLKWEGNTKQEIEDLMGRYAALPRHIAKKHLQAAMKRAMADGVPILRSVTPPLGVRRGRPKAGSFVPKNRTTGELRRNATAKAKYIGRNSYGVTYGVIGYRAGFNSRKAIWLEYGTRRGISPQRIIQQFLGQYSGPCLERLKSEMAISLDKAANELAGGRNLGWRP